MRVAITHEEAYFAQYVAESLAEAAETVKPYIPRGLADAWQSFRMPSGAEAKQWILGGVLGLGQPEPDPEPEPMEGHAEKGSAGLSPMAKAVADWSAPAKSPTSALPGSPQQPAGQTAPEPPPVTMEMMRHLASVEMSSVRPFDKWGRPRGHSEFGSKPATARSSEDSSSSGDEQEEDLESSSEEDSSSSSEESSEEGESTDIKGNESTRQRFLLDMKLPDPEPEIHADGKRG
eukprot:COSAG01_NODE_11212_length_1980_cov_64.410952_2_plen_233_part_00